MMQQNVDCHSCTYIGSKMITTAVRRRGPWFIMFLLCSCSLRMITLPPTGQSHEYDGAWLFASHEVKIWWKLAWASWSISHGDNDSASDIQMSCYVAEFILHRSQKLNPFDSCCTFNDSVISPPSLFNATQLYLSSFSLSVLVMALSVTSSAFSLSPCCSLYLFFYLLLRSAHFSRTHFPSASQATKYSDWCRQLGFLTNGKRSRGVADEHERWGEPWLVN